MNWRKSGLLSIPIAGLLLVMSGSNWGQHPPRAAEAAPLAAFNVNVVAQDCLADGNVRATISWSPMTLGFQWVDLSLFDNDFIPGTFIGVGRIDPFQSVLNWDDLLPGRLHFL